MKKITGFLICLFSVFVLCACGSGILSTNYVTIKELTNKEEIKKINEDFDSYVPVELTFYEANHGDIVITDADEIKYIWNTLMDMQVSDEGRDISIDDGAKAFFFTFEDGSSATVGFSTSVYYSENSLLYPLKSTSDYMAIYTYVQNLQDKQEIKEYWLEKRMTLKECEAVEGIVAISYEDNGDEARNVITIEFEVGDDTREYYIEGGYELLHLEKASNGYAVVYTYGDYYSHDDIEELFIFIKQ